ncbi:hypothetical protein Trydic_g6293 [Trypoxylus dichotomus]
MSRSSVPASKVKITMLKTDDSTSENLEYYQEAGNWRNIIFLPHNFFWKLLIVFTIVANCLLVCYNIFFTMEHVQGWFSTTYYGFEVFYFANLILVLMHRYMRYQRTQVYLPKPLALVVIDLITLLPYYEIYYLLKSKSKLNTLAVSKDYLRIKVVGRLATVMYFFQSTYNEPGLDHIVLISMKQFVIFFLYTMWISGYWFWLTSKYSHNWTKCLKYHQFNNLSMSSWFVISYTTVGNCLAHNWSGLIHSKNWSESLVISLTMTIGYLLHIMIYFGELITAYIKKISDQFEFSYRLQVIMRMLDNWNVDANVKTHIIDAYNILWDKRAGQRELPRLFHELPLTLQKQCSLDVHWYFIKHTQLLADMDQAFIRNMSLLMKCQYHMPGEYLYRLNEMKTRMVYIVSGVVQILSQEDQDSPVMSFSGGTVLSEMCCMRISYSNVNIRCASYCEIQTLDLRKFSRFLTKFPHEKHLLHTKLEERLKLARKMQNSELLKLKHKEQKRTSIKWIKSQWRNIALLTKGSKKVMEDRQKYIVPHHVSRFLNLYVLTDDVELKVSAICLNTKCPFVLEPQSTFRITCDYLILVAAITQSILIPYLAVFSAGLTVEQRAFLYMLDVVYVWGLYIELSTAVKVSGRMISKVHEIFIYKIKQTYTLIDIVSTIPLEFLGFLTSTDPQVEIIMHMNRVLKIYRLFRLIVLAELNVWRSYMKMRLVKFSFLFIFFLYVLSCFHYMHTCYKECERIGWYHYNRYLVAMLRTNETDNIPPFIASFNFVSSILISLTWNSNYSYSIKDMIIEHLIVLLGYFLFSFCFSQLGACAVLQLNAKNQYQLYLKGLKHFVMRKSIPHSMRVFMYTMIQCQWQYNDRHQISGPDGILADMPSHLADKVFVDRIVHCMKMSPLFLHCEDSTIYTIASMCKMSILPPGTIILRENTVATELIFIVRGYCNAESEIPTDKYHKTSTIMTVGDCFPVIEIFLEIRTFLKVTALTFVELISIPRKELIAYLKRSLVFYHDLEVVLQAHMDENHVVLTRQKGKLPEMVARIKAKSVGDYFTYETNEELGVKDDRFFEATFNILGKWKFLRHVLLKRTFVPTQRFYSTWEFIRCCLSISHVVYIVFFMKFSLILQLHRPIERIFFCVGLMDFYIRLHTAYYNKNGILVTHPLYTCLNYLKTSFLLDFLCIFPFGEMRLHYMFGTKHKHQVLLLMNNMTRPLLFYRIFNGITYLEDRSKEGRAILFHIVKYVLLVFVILAVLSLFLLAFSCKEKNIGMIMTCSNDSWLESQDLLRDEVKVYTNAVVSYYIVLSIFASCVVSLYTFRTKEEIIFMIAMAFVLFALRWFVLAKITSSRIGGNTMLVQYQHDIKSLLKFVKRNYVSKNLINEIVSHYEYTWKRTKGYTSTFILRSFHPVLRADFTYYLYAKTLRLSEIFKGVEVSVIRHISSEFEELHFKKDAYIIRCNDVGDTIYMVYKGVVDIYVANDKLCSLTPGGMFGCLKLQGMTRQTICAKAVVHVDLLAINCTKFNTIIANFPEIKKKLKRSILLNTEYILPLVISSSFAIHELEGNEVTRPGLVNKFTYFLISMDSIWYRTYNYFANVHIATISSLIVATMIVKVGDIDISKYYMYMYIFDGIFLFKIIIGLHLSYIDPDSGLQVKVFSSIWHRYVNSVTGFWLDLFTCLPFEIIASFVKVGDEWYRLFWINRVFRFLFMIKYYTTCKNTLIVSKHLRWSYLMYTLLLLMQVMILIWWKVACPNEICLYNGMIGHQKITFSTSNDTMVAFRITCQYVISIFSGTGLRLMVPSTSTELIAAVLMVCVAQFTQLSLTIGFASMLLLEKLVMAKYEKEAEHVLQYVKATALSLMLRSQIWKYYVMLWTRSQGSWVPTLIKECPLYLKQDVMGELYGKHIKNHFLFKKTHVDFIRQLLVHLNPYVFMPGIYIAELGDIDDCMYFIEEGDVIVYDRHGNNEIEQQILTAGRSFGEVQGVYGTAHERSYKARFVCKILVLDRTKWMYLLDWFPASKDYIYEQLARHFRKAFVAPSRTEIRRRTLQ